MTPEQLVSLAKEAMLRAYAPYSGFQVGAALHAQTAVDTLKKLAE